MEVDENGSFSVELTISDGANTITVTSTDAGGSSSTITRIVTLDVSSPIISEVHITPNPVSTGEILTITAIVSD